MHFRLFHFCLGHPACTPKKIDNTNKNEPVPMDADNMWFAKTIEDANVVMEPQNDSDMIFQRRLSLSYTLFCLALRISTLFYSLSQ